MTERIMPTIGSVVRYSDMANPGSTYVVLDTPKRHEMGWWTDYELRSTEEPFVVTASDLRQSGWQIFNDENETWERVLA